jgi:hypothetical protein
LKTLKFRVVAVKHKAKKGEKKLQTEFKDITKSEMENVSL